MEIIAALYCIIGMAAAGWAFADFMRLMTELSKPDRVKGALFASVVTGLLWPAVLTAMFVTRS